MISDRYRVGSIADCPDVRAASGSGQFRLGSPYEAEETRGKEAKRHTNEGRGEEKARGRSRKREYKGEEKQREGEGEGGPIEGTHVSHLVAAATCSRASVVVPANPAPTTTKTTTDNGRNSATRDALLVVATVAVVAAATVAVAAAAAAVAAAAAAAAAAAVAHVSRYARRIAPAPRHVCSRLARCED